MIHRAGFKRNAVCCQILFQHLQISDRAAFDHFCFALLKCFAQVFMRCLFADGLVYLRIQISIIGILIVKVPTEAIALEILFGENMMHIA